MVSPEAAGADYAQFAERNLDKMSWLYPLVNNRLGALLRVQLRHCQLFFVKDGLVVDEIGYGENGKRFHERDMGKTMRTPQEITAQGYWFIHGRHNAKAAYQALEEVQDGAYYSVFSNQCQDWANRVREKTVHIEKAQSLLPPPGQEADPALYRQVSPSVPSAWYFGMIALVVGILGLAAPMATGYHYLKFVGILLFAIGVSDIIYAFSSQGWKTLLSTAMFGILSILGGALIWANDHLFLTNSNALIAGVLAVTGLFRVGVALLSRPFSAWSGTLITGLLLCGTAWIAWKHRDGSAAAWLLGVALSVSFISAGVSTIWLNFRVRKTE